MATPSAPPPTPAALDNADTTDVIPTSPPDDVIDGNGTVITPEEMNLAELKVRVVCLEKESMALRMELKCAELQVANLTCFIIWYKSFPVWTTYMLCDVITKGNSGGCSSSGSTERRENWAKYFTG